MTERERTSMLSAGVILGAAALIRFVVLAPGEGAELLAERGSIADSLLAAGDSAAAEGKRRSRPLGEDEQSTPIPPPPKSWTGSPAWGQPPPSGSCGNEPKVVRSRRSPS